jgi:hypothetical protein
MVSMCYHEDIEDSPLEKPAFIFHKPFNNENLLTKIKELLDSSDPKKEEVRKRFIAQDAKWIKEHNIPGISEKAFF